MNLRQKRLAREIKEHILRLLHAEIRDPRLADVQVTAVIMSPDLSWAKVYWMLGEGAVADAVRAAGERLGKSEGFFKMHLARALRLRRVPRLRFYYDHSLARGQKIQELLTAALP